jgi:uncharacterized membrane protein YbhN (UPF0104 family)
MAMETETRPARKSLGWKRIVGYVISIVIVVAIFTWGIPKYADYHDVFSAIKTLTPLEFWSLLAATIFNLVTYWWANQAALPGLGIGKAAVLTQTTTSVANTLPAGGAIAIGLTYSILDSWGFTGTNVALYVGVTGIWNIFIKLGLPVLALVFLALSGHLTPAYLTAAVVGVAFLAVAVFLFALVFRSEAFAIRIGNGLARFVSRFRRLLRKPAVEGWGDGAARFRRDTIALVRYRWIRLTWTTVLSQLALFFVLLLSLRHMGVSQSEISTAEAFAVFAFSRLLSAVPITPGGVGLIDLGYIGGLTAFDSLEKAQIVAAVLLFRALTYGIQIPIGGFTYIIWRVKSDWRRPADAEAQRERVRYFGEFESRAFVQHVNDHLIRGQVHGKVNLFLRALLVAVVKRIDHPFAHAHPDAVAIVFAESGRFSNAQAHLLREIHAFDLRLQRHFEVLGVRRHVLVSRCPGSP